MLAQEDQATASSKPIVNDFTFQAATINGSGSQSSNLIIARTIFSMGIPVSPKNVFPSNIEGLPTWFSIRLSPDGYQCRTDDVDVLVALNPTTWQRDIQGVNNGAAVVHESTYPVTGNMKRDDVHYYAVPFHKLGQEHVDNPDLRKYLTNMIYVGTLAWLIGIPLDTVEKSLAQQFAKKPKVIPSNMNMIRIGHEFMAANHQKRDAYTVQPMRGRTEGKILIEGNQSLALGAIMGGCTVAAWYPITPSSSVCEYLDQYANKFRIDPKTGEKKIAIIQAEDELAAAGMVIGAGWAGARSMTATSGPGLSLMAEFAGLAYYAEVPMVVMDIQRIGPSTGLPTRTSQGDIEFAHLLSHGDTKHIVLIPGTVEECYEMGQMAFDLADRLQTVVFVLSDLDLGMNLWMSEKFKYPEKKFDRGKVLSAKDLERIGEWGRYKDVDDDGIPWRTLPGTNHPSAGYFTRGSGHDEYANYTELPEVYERVMDRLKKKYKSARRFVPKPIIEDKGNSVGIIAYGTTHHAVVEARKQLEERGLKTDYCRVRAIPHPQEVMKFIVKHDRVYVVDQNRDGQMYDLLRLTLNPTQDNLLSVRHYDGTPIPARAIVAPILIEEGIASPSEFERARQVYALPVEAANA
ncbi:MAG: 2-oxoglutarate/2-oxoacid ferredoxin oxidoreductase subunit alpha [Chloroflexota bacterium]|nr:2-oxoglutarate/2-oxoacid ferredoxin oxidoreductase subunit alpha [Chloroflexota bacterium]